MKKIIVLLSFISFATILSAQLNLRNFEKSFDILSDTTSNKNGVNREYNKFLKKNTKRINAEVFQVIGNDTLSYALVKVFKGSQYNYSIALLMTYDEILYEGKEINNELCFLAGAYTYESKGSGVKTVPAYYTMPCYRYQMGSLLALLYSKIKAIFDQYPPIDPATIEEK